MTTVYYLEPGFGQYTARTSGMHGSLLWLACYRVVQAKIGRRLWLLEVEYRPHTPYYVVGHGPLAGALWPFVAFAAEEATIPL